MQSLKNQETGLDVTVPSVQEVEAPLGGTSVEYEVSILTNLPAYKSHVHKDDDVVRYSVQRAYRELEDFCDKIEKKFKDVSLPPIPKGRAVLQCSSEEKRAALDAFMQRISRNKEICQSPLFCNFLGINRLKAQHLSSSEQPATGSTDPKSGIFGNEVCDSTKTTDIVTSRSNSTKSGVSNFANSDLEGSNISELFPKVKVRKASKPEPPSAEVKTNDPAEDSLLFSSGHRSSVYEEDLDLFEEAKQSSKNEKKEEKLFEAEKKSQKGLFDDFDEDQLFSGVSVKANHNFSSSSKASETDKANKVTKPKNDKLSLFDSSPSFEEENDLATAKVSQKGPESNRIHSSSDSGDKKRKENVLLFEEQDFGAGITKEDEQLFFVAKKEEKPTVVNPFLSPVSDETESDDRVAETLEDLMKLPEPSVPLKKSHVPAKATEPASGPEARGPRKPVPLPRNKPPGNPPAEEKPQVAPRKVFMTKPPVPASKPSVPQKPVPPPKPKLSKPVGARETEKTSSELNRVVAPKQVETSESRRLPDDLSTFDIMKYIEEEEKAASEGASLFD